MGTPLTGKTPANTYDALIKIGDNSPLTSNLKVLSDGLGNDLPLTVSSTAITITGNATFSANVDATSAVLTVATQSANDNSTKAASTAYVDNSSGNADLDFGGDNASTGNVLLNTQTFQVSGTANEIVTAASNQSLTFSLDSSGVNLPDNSTAITQTAGDSSTKIATTAFVSSESLAQDLDFSGDTGTGAVILNTETFAVTGTTNQIETTASGTGLALSLPSTVHRNLQGNVTGNLTGNVTGDLTGNVTATSVLVDGVIGTTQAVADDSTKVATTAFVQDVVGTIPAGLVFQGTWNANTNTPTLASGTGTTGHFYIVSVAGTTDLDGVTDWAVGDWAVFVEQGATDQWEKVDNSSVLDGNGTGGKISKWAGSGNSVTLTDSVITEDSSNIGIGDASPERKLHVNSGSENANTIFESTDTAVTVRFKDTTGEAEIESRNDFRFSNNAGANQRMVIGSDGAIKFNNYGAGTLVSDASGNITSISGGGEGGPYLPLAGGTMTGNLALNDNVKALFGASYDLQIYHDASNSFIQDSGTGDLYVLANNLRLANADNSGQFINANNGGAVELYHNNSKKLETTSSGVTMSGGLTINHSSGESLLLTKSTTEPSVRFEGDTDKDFVLTVSGETFTITQNDGATDILILDHDTKNATFGGDVSLADDKKLTFGASDDLQIYHDGSNSFIRENGTGVLTIDTNGSEIQFNKGTSDYMLRLIADAGVKAYYDNSLKFETTSAGVEVAGARSNTAGVVSLGLNASDSTIHYGFRLDQTNNAFNIDRVDSALNLMNLSTSGNATFAGTVTAGSYFLGDDTSISLATTGAGTVFLRPNGQSTSGQMKVESSGNATFAGDVSLSDNKKLKFGAGPDLEIYHNSTTNVNHISSLLSRQLSISADTTTFSGNVGLGGTGIFTPSASLNIDGLGLAIKNDTNGSSNNWSLIKNTDTGSNSNLVFISGQGTAFTINHDKSATFEGEVTFDNVINAVRGSFVSTLQDATVLSAEGAYSSSGSVKLFEAKRSGGAVASDWSYDDATTDMSLGTSTSHSFSLKTGNTRALTIDSSQNVGIGLTSPAHKIDVSDDSTNWAGKILNTNARGYGLLVRSDSTTASDLIFGAYGNGGAGAGYKMAIQAAGNVGLGTISLKKLHIFDSTQTNQTIRFGNPSATPLADINYNSSGNEFLTISCKGTTTGFGNIVFETGSNPTEAMRIDSNRNFLVGKTGLDSTVVGAELRANGQTVLTADGDNPLDLTRLTNDGAIALFRKDSSVIGSIGSNTTGGQPLLDIAGATGNSNIRFLTTNTERMRIDSSGNVQVRNSSVPTIQLYNTDTSLGTDQTLGDLDWYQSDPSGDGVGVVAKIRGINQSSFQGEAGLAFYTGGSSSILERMRIDSSGNVLIGTTGTPNGTSVYGSGFIPVSNGKVALRMASSSTAVGTLLEFFNPNGSVGNITITGSATAYNTSSDYRLKENVVEMTGALDRVAQLKPSRFNFIADADKVVDGFLAHEVQSVVPEAITGTKDGMKDEEYEKTPAVYEDKVHPAIEEEKDEEGNVITEAKESWTEKVLVSEAVMDTRSVPDYQGIDQSKLVPLLVGAIQELRAEIELLKAK